VRAQNESLDNSTAALFKHVPPTRRRPLMTWPVISAMLVVNHQPALYNQDK